MLRALLALPAPFKGLLCAVCAPNGNPQAPHYTHQNLKQSRAVRPHSQTWSHIVNKFTKTKVSTWHIGLFRPRKSNLHVDAFMHPFLTPQSRPQQWKCYRGISCQALCKYGTVDQGFVHILSAFRSGLGPAAAKPCLLHTLRWV